MPNRMLRDWTDSETVDSLDYKDEVFFVRLIMKADDFGRFSANPKILRSLLFPLKDGLRDTDMTRSLAACQKAGLVRLYSFEEKPLLEIANFGQRLQQKASKYPSPADPGISPASTVECGDPPPEVEEKRSRREVEGADAAQNVHKDFVSKLKQNPAYSGIDIDKELHKMDAWLDSPAGRGRKKSQRFILNWLNKAEADLPRGNARASDKTGKWKADAGDVVFLLTDRPWSETTKADLRKLKPAIQEYAEVAKPWIAARLSPEQKQRLAEVWREES